NTQDILPCFLPFFHIYGLVITLLGHLTHGCKLVTMSKFSASVYLDLLKTQPMNLLYIVPPVAILLGKHPDVSTEHFRNVRHIREIEFNQGFGATETTSLGTSTFKKTKNIDFSACGVPMAGVTLKFIDPATGQPSGEMCVKSPMIMKGYHKNPQATADTMSDDGYFKTGDLGHYKPGVGLFITDRIKELIKFYGEAPKAFIIRKSGQTTSEEELQDFVAGQVAGYKKIEEVMFVQDIPKTASGKILRKDLKKIYALGRSSGSSSYSVLSIYALPNYLPTNKPSKKEADGFNDLNLEEHGVPIEKLKLRSL
ncbi:AMP dependent coa ligase, partial [Operophtera brumata]